MNPVYYWTFIGRWPWEDMKLQNMNLPDVPLWGVLAAIVVMGVILFFLANKKDKP